MLKNRLDKKLLKKKDKMNTQLEQFAKEHELTVLSEKDQELLGEFGGNASTGEGNSLAVCVTNNCKGGNCAPGCGTNGEEYD